MRLVGGTMNVVPLLELQLYFAWLGDCVNVQLFSSCLDTLPWYPSDLLIMTAKCETTCRCTTWVGREHRWYTAEGNFSCFCVVQS